MVKVSTVEARDNFSEIINRAAYGKERIILTRRGKDLAVVIPIEDLTLIEELEDRLDLEAAIAAEEEAAAKGEEPIPWEKVRDKLDL